MSSDGASGLESQLARLPQRQLLTDNVYESIKALVMDHVLQPGARVTIDGLARLLHVSQTPLREALARLESDDLVTKEPLRGYSVSPLLTREEFDDLHELRMRLEPWSARRAAERATESERAQLRAEMDAFPTYLGDSGGNYEVYKALAAHDIRLHRLILSVSGNRAVAQTWDRMHCHLHQYRLYFGTGLSRCTFDEHDSIVDAIVGGDPDSAELAMATHLRHAHARIASVYAAGSAAATVAGATG